MKKTEQEVSSQTAIPKVNESATSTSQPKRKLLNVLGQLKTREVIDSQEICREVRGKSYEY